MEALTFTKMARYTLEEGLIIVKTHYKNGKNFTVTIRGLRDYFGIVVLRVPLLLI